jgi:acyl dehydratase
MFDMLIMLWPVFALLMLGVLARRYCFPGEDFWPLAEKATQPVHLDDEVARGSIFKGLAASGWHTAALTMRLLVESELKPAGGIIGLGFDELRWPNPTRPDDCLHLDIEVLEVRASRSRPDQGVIKLKTTTLNQRNEAVQISVGNLLVQRRNASPS